MQVRLLATATAANFAISGSNPAVVTVPPPPLPTLRAYSTAVGTPIDIAGQDATGDAAQLTNAGYILLGTSGVTAARPTNPKPGQWHIDLTLNAAVVWDGGAWRNPATGASV